MELRLVYTSFTCDIIESQGGDMSQKKPESNTQGHHRIATRNWLAVRAFQRGGAGRHTDKKKAANKRACRGKVQA